MNRGKKSRVFNGRVCWQWMMTVKRWKWRYDEWESSLAIEEEKEEEEEVMHQRINFLVVATATTAATTAITSTTIAATTAHHVTWEKRGFTKKD